MSGPVIVFDDAIPHGAEAFAGLGRVRGLPAAALTGERLVALGAELLVVRSVTCVDAALLDAAPGLRFVGTATAGTDHLDLAELDARGIATASSAGCNANAVAQWVIGALAHVGDRLAALEPGPIGVVGYGNVGRRLAAMLRGLGCEVLACDPPLARAQARGEAALAEPFVAFDELWRRCSVVSFHVPLISEGPDATLAYVDLDRPAAAGPKLLINTSRGPVIRERALDRGDVAAMILDVWDGEPELRPARLEDPRLLLASPHVAGYSLEAKIAGTRMMHEALSAALGRAPSWTGARLCAPRTLDGPLGGFETLPALITRVIDFIADDAAVRALAALPNHARSRHFEALRRGYALRREFGSWQIRAGSIRDPRLSDWAQEVGFSLV